jgi:hypothetical protein
MKTLLAAAILLVALGSVARADYSVWDRGVWPESWPKELEPLRKQARTFEGPIMPERRYLIPFTKREEFEAAWPHLLEAKTKGAPIILLRGPKTDFFEVKPAGVLIHGPAADKNGPFNAEAPLPGAKDARTKWMSTTYIELVVDGEIVDLNRIPLPKDTPIVDERFKGATRK